MTILDIFIEATDNASDEFSDVDGALSGLGQTAGAAASAGLAIAATAVAAVGAAAVGAGVAALNLSTDINNATNSIATGLGISQEEASGFQDVMRGIFANNFGESFNDIGLAVAEVTRQMGEMPDDALQGITENAFALRDAFDVDVGESVQAAAVLMEEMGLSGEEAMDFIAAGMQRGLNNSDDFLDSITEYGGLFGDAGFEADEFFSLMESGAEAGVLGTDKIADAIKEMGIILNEGGADAADVFETMGLDMDAVSEAVAAGEATWADYFPEILDGLQSIEDPIERNKAQVTLFGTAAEDLGVSFTEGLSMATTSLEEMGGATEALNAQYDNWPSMWEGIKRSFLLALEPLGDLLLDIGNRLMPIVQAAFERIQTDVIPILTLWFDKLALIWEAIDGGMTPLQAITDFLRNNFGPEFANAFGIAVQVVGTLADVLETVLGTAFANMQSVYRAFVSLFEGDFQAFGSNLAQIFQNNMNMLVSILGSLWSLIQPILAQFWSSFVGWFHEQDWRQIGLDLIDSILTGLKTFAEMIVPVIADWIKNLTEWVDNVDWVQVGHDVVIAIVEALKYFNDVIIPTLQEWRASFFNWFGEQDWGALANSIIDGIIGGLNSLKESLFGAIRGIAQGAMEAFAGVIGMGSPATEFIPHGESMLGGIMIGMTNMIGQLVGLFAQIADTVEVEAAKELSEAIQAVSAAIIPAMEAMLALIMFTTDARAVEVAMTAFKDAVFYLAWGMAAAAARLNSQSAGFGVKDAGKMAAAVAAVSESVIDAIGAINALAEFTIIDISVQMTAFSQLISDLVFALVGIAVQLSAEGLIHAQLFAESAIAILAIVVPAIDAIRALGEFVGASNLLTIVQIFVGQLSLVVSYLVSFFDSISDEMAEAIFNTASFTDSINAIISLIIPGLEAISALADYVRVNNFGGSVHDFTTSLVNIFVMMSENLGRVSEQYEEVILRSADFAASIAAVISLVVPGLEAISALADYVRAEDFGTTVAHFAEEIAELALTLAVAFGNVSEIIGDAVLRAGAMSSAINALSGLVQPGIDALLALVTYEPLSNISSHAESFAEDLTAAIWAIATAFDTFLSSLLEALAFAEQVSPVINTIVGIIQPSIDALLALATYKPLRNLSAHVAAFAEDLVSAIWEIAQALSMAFSSTRNATGFAEQIAPRINAIVGLVQPGIDALLSLATYKPLSNLRQHAQSFADDLVSAIWEIAQALSQAFSSTRNATIFAEQIAPRINAIVGLVQPGVDALTAMMNYEPIKNMGTLASRFAINLVTAVEILATALAQAFTGRIATALRNALASVEELIPIIDLIIGLIQPGIDALTAMLSYEPVKNMGSLASQFSDDLVVAVEILAIALAQAFTGRIATSLRNALNSVTDLIPTIDLIIGLIQPGIDALTSMLSYEPVKNMGSIASQFADDLVTAVGILADALSQAFSGMEDSLEAAVAIGSQIGQISSIIEPGINALVALLEFSAEGDIAEASQTFVDGIIAMANTFTDAAETSAEILASAAVFVENTDQAVNGIESLLGRVRGMFENLQELATTDIPGGISSIMSDVIAVLQETLEPAYQAGLDFGEAWIQGLRDAFATIGGEVGGIGGDGGLGEGVPAAGVGGLTTNVTLGGLTFNVQGTGNESADDIVSIILETLQDLVTG